MAPVAFALVAATPVRATTLFGLVDTGEVFASIDAGATWEVRAALPVSDAVALTPGASSELLLATQGGTILSSVDAGHTWTAIGSVTAGDVVDVVGLPDGSFLLLTGSGVVYESADDGVSWTATASITGSDLASIVRFQGRTLVASESGVVHESVTGAPSIVVGAIPTPDLIDLRVRGGALDAMSRTGDVWHSADAGTWEPVATLSQVGMAALSVVDGELLAVSREGHVAASSDGVGWAWRGTINQVFVVGLGSDAAVTGLDEAPPVAVRISLSPPWPNPRVGTGSAHFRLGLDRAGAIELGLFDVTGRRLATRTEMFAEPGAYVLEWDPGPLAPGVYYVRLESRTEIAGTRWVVVR